MNKADVIAAAKRMIERMSRVTVACETTADCTVTVAGEDTPRLCAHVRSRLSPTLAAITALAAAAAAVSVLSLFKRR